MKKVLLVALLAVLAVSGAVCGGNAEVTDIKILVPNATHGWTGAVMTYAQEKADEINAAGKYSATVITCSDSANQIAQIEDIVANRSAKSVVILPNDNATEAAMRQLVGSGIPVVQFDRSIAAVKDQVVTSVEGDNEGIGYATAKRFIANGLEVGDEVYVLIGDTSSVPGMRNAGFEKGLKEAGWTDADIKASIEYSAPTGWQKTTAQTMFVDWMNSKTVSEIENFDWIFTHDDPLAMGIFDALKTTELDDAKKAAFLSGHVNLASSAGAAENYSVMKGVHEKDYSKELAGLADYFSVTYDPAMIQIAIDDMVMHLDGKTVEQYHLVPVAVVDSTNVDNFRGFGDSYAK